jgi:hypothetical protein
MRQSVTSNQVMKRPGSRLSNTSETLLDALPADLANRLVAARRAVAAAAGLDETTLMPAWRRFAGTLYQSAFGLNVDPVTLPPFERLLIPAALMASCARPIQSECTILR